jgi:hypothetical protein
MGGYGGTVQPFLTSSVDRSEWSASRPCFFNFGDRAPFTQPQSRPGRLAKEKNLFPIPGIKSRILGGPVPNLVAVPTELSRIA